MKVLQAEAKGPRTAFQKGVETVQKWASHLGHHLNSCNRLASIFRAQGLKDVYDEMMSTN
jgi:hypothetical protein